MWLFDVCVRAGAGVWSSIDNVAVFRLRTYRSKPEQQKKLQLLLVLVLLMRSLHKQWRENW